MNCPKCTNDSGVTDSRHIDNGAVIRRRRRCGSCRHRFTTAELLIPDDFVKEVGPDVPEGAQLPLAITRMNEFVGLLMSMPFADRQMILEVVRRFKAAGPSKAKARAGLKVAA